jgi:hypothetical protein
MQYSPRSNDDDRVTNVLFLALATTTIDNERVETVMNSVVCGDYGVVPQCFVRDVVASVELDLIPTTTQRSEVLSFAFG